MRLIVAGPLLVVVLSVVAAVPCFAAMSQQEIAKLPADKVRAIQQHYAQHWPKNYSLRMLCEDGQYRALRTLIERNR
jgi:hypothetical protein